jgi:hypothetical protein
VPQHQRRVLSRRLAFSDLPRRLFRVLSIRVANRLLPDSLRVLSRRVDRRLLPSWLEVLPLRIATGLLPDEQPELLS